MANTNAATYYTDLLKKQQGIEQYPNTGSLGGGLYVNAPTSPTIASAPTSSTTAQDYIQRLSDAQMQSKIASLSAARDASLSALDQQQKAIAPQYYDARNSVAAQAGKERLALNEQAAQTGLGSGATAYMQSLGKTSMQNSLGALQRDEAKSVADIEAQKAAARQQFESAMVQAKLDGDAQRYSALLDAYVRNETQAREDARYAESLAMDKDNIAYSREQDALNQKMAQAKYMAQYGVFDGFKELGYSDSQIAQMKQQYTANQIAKQTKTTTNTQPATPSMSVTNAKNLAKQGYFDDAVITALYNAGYSDQAILAAFPKYVDYYMPQGAQPTQPTAQTPPAGTSDIRSAIYEAMMKSGDMGQWLNENGAYMTPEEQLYAASILRSGR